MLFAEEYGAGPPLMLLHPFPADHTFWSPLLPHLTSRYRVITPDLRGSGESTAGEGPATMAKHAADIDRICEFAKVKRAVFIGVSIGGTSVTLMGNWIALNGTEGVYVAATGRDVTIGLGASGTVNVVPSALEATYGSRTPRGATVFLRLRPYHTPHELP